jgi:DNA adenine methylase
LNSTGGSLAWHTLQLHLLGSQSEGKTMKPVVPIEYQQLNSPFRYAGGKFYARKLILPLIPDHDVYIEPFCGGASIFFAKPKSKKNVLNDFDVQLINCFEHIRDKPEDLIRRLHGQQATKERHAYYKNTYRPRTDLDRAVRWYYLNRTSYSGIMKAVNCFFGYGDKFSMRPENWPRSIRKTSEKLAKVKLTSVDFVKCIDSAPDGSFLFIDPPYYRADQNKFYTCSFTLNDHERLSDCLRKNQKRIKFLLTYDDCPEVRELYSWIKNIRNAEWNYTINRTDDQKTGKVRKGERYQGQELFIMNYEPLVRTEVA